MVKAEALGTVVETIVIEDQIDYSQPFVRRLGTNEGQPNTVRYQQCAVRSFFTFHDAMC